MMLDKPMNSLILKFLICRIEKASNYHLVQLLSIKYNNAKVFAYPRLTFQRFSTIFALFCSQVAQLFLLLR